MGDIWHQWSHVSGSGRETPRRTSAWLKSLVCSPVASHASVQPITTLPKSQRICHEILVGSGRYLNNPSWTRLKNPLQWTNDQLFLLWHLTGQVFRHVKSCGSMADPGFDPCFLKMRYPSVSHGFPMGFPWVLAPWPHGPMASYFWAACSHPAMMNWYLRCRLRDSQHHHQG